MKRSRLVLVGVVVLGLGAAGIWGARTGDFLFPIEGYSGRIEGDYQIWRSSTGLGRVVCDYRLPDIPFPEALRLMRNQKGWVEAFATPDMARFSRGKDTLWIGRVTKEPQVARLALDLPPSAWNDVRIWLASKGKSKVYFGQ